MKINIHIKVLLISGLIYQVIGCANILTTNNQVTNSPRERILLDGDWRFFKYNNAVDADALIYDVRPEVTASEDGKPADAEPTAAVPLDTPAQIKVLKPWILPSGNDFILDPAKHHQRPAGNPGENFAFVQNNFDDSHWQPVNIPHDWAINGPFYRGWNVAVGGGMGRLPSPGVAWYRKTIDIPAADKGKTIYLDIDGAMSYAMVWLNGHLVGGWPYGYASWRLDLTPYVQFDAKNQLAIRMDNPPDSSRWYPGGGLYRNVWLTKTQNVHVDYLGTFVTTPKVSTASATVNLAVTLKNNSTQNQTVLAETSFYLLDSAGHITGKKVATSAAQTIILPAKNKNTFTTETLIIAPKLWGPPPEQKPHRYVAITQIKANNKIIDQYETRFGIRSLQFDPSKGLLVNNQPVYLKGVNQHHDLGALGAAFNVRAAKRQLLLLREMGANAIRLAHNPPAPELLELTDQMGFIVIDEIFDVWERKKTPLDFHLIFPDWHEADLRAFLRRDRNHPSVVMWSLGNEVGEQYTGKDGADVSARLNAIAKQEDPTRPTTVSMNFAKPHMPLPATMDAISLNYQGEGIRNAPAYQHLQGIRTEPVYPAFHQAFPDKFILSSENAAAVSSRGEYLFPVTDGISAPVADGAGGDPKSQQVSAYELYTAPFGSSADKVFGSLEQHPFVGGGFVWSGWDYLGEPTPYYGARSSYFGVIDLAGFKKDRFYLYQAHWRPNLPMAHILPHWNWPERIGEITPVHVFTSGDSAELFLNGKSLGKKIKEANQYRLRWDDVQYTPGELKVIAYKDGKPWAQDIVVTTGAAAKIQLDADAQYIKADGKDLVFITAKILDQHGNLVPRANNPLTFSLSGPGEIIATDNGDATNLVAFNSLQRQAFNGLCLVIVRALPGQSSQLQLRATAEGLGDGSVSIKLENL